MLILNSMEMREVENHAFANGMPVEALMEKAAYKSFEYIASHYPKEEFNSIAVIAGPGHNGGDALVIARELLLSGREVKVWSGFSSHKELTKKHLQWFRTLGGKVVSSLAELENASLCVDGLLGFGNEKTLSGAVLEAVNFMNQHFAKRIIAIDIPSGLNSDTGQVLGNAVVARETLCLGFLKTGLINDNAKNHTHKITLIDIGLNEALVAKIFPRKRFPRALDFQTFQKYSALDRNLAANKYTAGHVFMCAGSEKYPGAALLTLAGIHAGGAGYVTADIPSALTGLVVSHFPATVVNSDASFILHEYPEQKMPQAVVCGPGLDLFYPKLKAILDNSKVPLVLDADALIMLANNHKGYRFARPCVLTPHFGEFKKLFPEINPNQSKIELALEAAKQVNAVIVLKGPYSVVASPGGEVVVNLDASVNLASAGTGDVLAGLISSYAAKDGTLFHAAACGVFAHAQASLTLEKKYGFKAVDPLNLAKAIEMRGDFQ